MRPPVPYDPTLEAPEAGEAETLRGLLDALSQVQGVVAEDEGRPFRAVHAKAHGLLDATLTVLPGLPPELAQGLFAAPGDYRATLRLSTNPGDLLGDGVSLPRGLALKVRGVEGERLPGSEGSDEQDLLLVNAPAFSAASAKAFLRNLRLLAKTTDRAEWAKVALSATLRTVERAVEAVGLESAALKTLGGARNVHPLGETYWTQTAFRHGALVAKHQVAPASPNLAALTGVEIETSGRPDAIREEVDAAARAGAMDWELRAQLCRDAEAMPVEDPTVRWDEGESPFLAVARLRAEAQPAWDGDAERADAALRFSPWTGLAAHRPLGVINRVRRETYEASAAYRAAEGVAAPAEGEAT